MQKNKMKVTAEINGMIYQSEVDRYMESEGAEQIASCIRQIGKMLNENGLSDVCPEYKIEKKE